MIIINIPIADIHRGLSSKRRRAGSDEAYCQWAQIATLPFTFTPQKYVYPSVILWMRISELLSYLWVDINKTKE